MRQDGSDSSEKNKAGAGDQFIDRGALCFSGIGSKYHVKNGSYESSIGTRGVLSEDSRRNRKVPDGEDLALDKGPGPRRGQGSRVHVLFRLALSRLHRRKFREILLR